MKKKVIKIEKEKNFVQKNLEWATAHLYCKKKNCIAGCKAKLYCKRRPLHCIMAGLRVFILQYTVLYCRKKNQCIAMNIVLQDGCRRPKCVAIQNCIVTRGAGTGRRRGAGHAGWALGAQAVGRWARGRAGGRQQARAARACGGWARADTRGRR